MAPPRSSRDLATCLFASVVLVFAGLAGCVRADEVTSVPSDPRTWATDFDALHVRTPACPDGDVRPVRARDPAMRPYAPKAYAAASGDDLRNLTGVRDSDEVYPVALGWSSPDGQFSAVHGFLLVRDGCVIHVQVTGHDN